MLLEQVVAATCASQGARACDIVTDKPIMLHGDCFCDAVCVAKKTREKVHCVKRRCTCKRSSFFFFKNQQTPSRVLFKICLRVFGKHRWNGLDSNCKPTLQRPSKAVIEDMHQRAVDTRWRSRSLLGVLC